jgi:hypothetical protein
MRTATLAAVLALAAAPASAQPPDSKRAASPTATQPSPSSGTAGQQSTAAQVKLRQSLEQAGFKQVQIVDAAYLVHARTSDGNRAIMYIDPPSMAVGFGTTGSTTGADKPQRQAMTQSKLRGSLEKAGFEKVKIVDAAYLVKADTGDGGQALMYINPPPAPGRSGQSGSPATPGNQEK